MASKKHLDNILGELASTLKSTKAFVVKEAPSVLREVLAYYRLMNIIYVVSGLLLIVTSLVLLHNGYAVPHELKESYNGTQYLSKDIPDMAIVLWILAGISGLVGTIVTFNNLPDLIQVFIAPKVFLIEYIKNSLD